MDLVKEKKKEKIKKELNQIDREIEILKNKLGQLLKEEKEKNLENIKYNNIVKKYKERLENKKQNISNSVDINIHIEEKIEIERRIKIFEENHKSEIGTFNELKKQINEIENEINFYKLKKIK